MRGSEGDRDADQDAGKDQRPTLAQDHSQHVAALSAERHPDSDFLRALGHGIRDDAVKSDRREERGEASENREEQHRESSPQNRVREHVLHRPRIRQRYVRSTLQTALCTAGNRPSGFATALRTAKNIEGHCVWVKGT